MAHGSRLTAHGEIAPSHDLTENSDLNPEISNLNLNSNSHSNSNSNSKLKKLSVIIPAYNTEKFLRKCVESVANQTYKNIEIIIVDDGSKDSTPQICDELKDKYENVIVIHQENKGSGKTREIGLNTSTGDYITFVDSDDYIDVTAYEKAIKVLEENDCDMVQFGYYEVLPDGKIIFERHRKILTINNSRDAFSYFFNLPDVAVWSKVYKRHLFNDIEWLKISMAEDYCISAQVFAKTKKFMTIDEQFYYYVKNPESITQVSFKNKSSKDDLIKAYNFVVNFTEKNFPECLPDALWRYFIILKMIYDYYSQLQSDEKNEVLSQVKLKMRELDKKLRHALKKRNVNIKLRTDFGERNGYPYTFKARAYIWLSAYCPWLAVIYLKIRLKIHALTGI